MSLNERAMELIRLAVQFVYCTDGYPLLIHEEVDRAWRQLSRADEEGWRHWFRSLNSEQRGKLMAPYSEYDPWRAAKERLRWLLAGER